MKTDYRLLAEQLKALTEGNAYRVTALANASALLYGTLENLNWCGFYLLRDRRLILGPFQGKVACTEIPEGKGVCGTALARRETVRVEDVHTFEGHIACDCASNSEIVIPLFVDGEVYGVLDVDSPLTGRFTEEDRRGLEETARVLETALAGIPD